MGATTEGLIADDDFPNDGFDVIRDDERPLPEAEEASIASQLEECEECIQRGGNAIVKSLTRIRDRKLYRLQYASFECYCQERWRMSRAHAYRLISHGTVLENLACDPELSPIGDKISEAATREMSGLSPEDQVKVAKQVAKTSRKPTAKAVKAVRQQVEAERKSETTTAKDSTASKPSTASIVKDAIGRTVPDELREAFSLSPTLTNLSRQVEQIRKDLMGLLSARGAEHVDISHINDCVRKLRDAIIEGAYHTECPRCRGTISKTCVRCKGAGFIPRKLKGQLSPDESAWLRDQA